MSEPFIGQIQAFGFNYAPMGWAKCDGQLLSIQQYSALYALLGTTYGGDGVNTFGVPDLRGRVSLHYGSGPGLTTRSMGEKAGTETVTLTADQIPAHTHSGSVTVTGTVQCNSGDGNADTPVGNALAKISRNSQYSNAGASSAMADGTVYASGNFTTSTTGGGHGHPNMQPYLVVNYCIALEGIFPSRS